MEDLKKPNLCMLVCMCLCVHVHVCVYCTYRPIIHTHGMCQRSIASIFIGLIAEKRLCFRVEDSGLGLSIQSGCCLC